jgi:16S rRNA (cytidine1402-2'-O)-methyltransferase
VVATPIGNLQDLSPRAAAVLAAADLIAAEDTRRTLKLLNHLQLKKKMVSYHAHNWRSRDRISSGRCKKAGISRW